MLNVPLLAGTLIALAILSPAAYCWHSYQLSRTADSLLEEAGRLKEEGEHAKAAAYIHRYLRLHPGDAEARVRLAKTFDKSANDPSSKLRAINLYYRALGLSQDEIDDATRRDLRSRLVELLLEVAPYDRLRYALAEAEAEKLLDTDKEDPQAWRLLALALVGQLRSGALEARPEAGDREDQDPVSIIEALDRAIQLNPAQSELAISFAHICRHQDQLCSEEKQALGKAFARICPDGVQPAVDANQALTKAQREQLADKMVDQMVAANPKDPDTLLARYNYRIQYKYKLPGAKNDLESALRHGPENLDVVLAAAQQARLEAAGAQRAGASADEVETHLDEARRHYEHAVQLSPRDERAYLGLGNIYLTQGKTDSAIETWRQGLQKGDGQGISLNARLAEVLITAGRLDEAWNPDPDTPEERAAAAETALYKLAAAVRRLAPRLTLSKRLALDRSIHFLNGMWFVQNREYAKAVPLLKEMTAGQPADAGEVARAYQACGLLSTAYGNLGEWGDAARSWEQAASLQPKLPTPRVAAAEAWSRAGRLDLAIRQYKLALAAADDPQVQFQLANAQFAEQLGLPKEQRDWSLFETALAELKNPKLRRSLDEAWRLDLLEASYLLAQSPEESPGDGAEAGRSPATRAAKDLLDKARRDYPDSPGLFRTLIAAYERLGYQEETDRALATFRRLTPGSPASYLLECQVFCLRKQYDEARELLKKGVKELTAESGTVLRAALPDVSLAAGELERAKKELESLHKADPSNTTFMWRLADLALRMNRIDDLKQWESKLREAEGPDGLYWRYCRARRFLNESLRIMVEAKGTRDRKIVEKARTTVTGLVGQAGALSSNVRKQRPNWARAYELSGRVLQQQAGLEGTVEGRRLQYQRAVEAYQRAISLGADQIAVYERVIPLLTRLRRFDEADRYLALLKTRGGSSQNLLQYEISAAARQGGLPEAIEAARRGVQARPRDADVQIWLGRLLLADGQEQEAEAAMKQAIKLAPTDAGPYEALVDFYVRTKQRERAKETIQQLAEKARLSKLQLALVLARSYEQLADLRQAEAKYREAEQLVKDNVSLKVAIKSRLAAIFSRSDLAQAEKVLREILELAPESDAARQSLAGLLAQRALASPGDQGADEWQEIERLLQRSASGAEVSSSNRRLQAALRLRRGGKRDLEQAGKTLEKLVEDAKGDTDVDRFYLARVYAAQSEPYRADAERYQKLDDENKLSQAGSKLRESHQQYTGLFRKSRQQFLAIVARDEPNPSYLESYVDLLLRHKEALPRIFQDEATRWRKKLETIVTQPQPNAQLLNRYFALLRRHNLQDETDQWLTKLEKLLPDDLYIIGLRVTWLHERKQTSQIEPLVERLADRLLKKLETSGQRTAQQEAQLCLAVGNVYSSVQQHPAAERWYRRLGELVPEGYAPLTISLVRQGRLTEAIGTCLQAARSDSSARPAITLASALTLGNPTHEDYRLAEPLLAKAVEDHSDNADLLASIANVRIVQQRTDDAVQLYRQVLKLRPKDVLTLNNLATLLSERADTREEALQCVERAIRIAGPQSQLLDTKGTALVLGGKPDKAIPWLEKAASALKPDPRYHLHLAVAYQQAGKIDKARSALKHAQAGNLAGEILMPTDEKYLSELEQQLGQ